MDKIWIISDTHWFHRKIEEYENRPSNYNELIIDNWNKYISNDDLVIHLGDFALTSSERTKQLIKQLTGKKVIVLGNHDKSSNFYMSNGFNFACNSFTLRYSNYNILFTHMPNYDTIYDINIHGHQHSNSIEVTDKHFCFSIERTNYMPLLLNEILRRYQKGKTKHE